MKCLQCDNDTKSKQRKYCSAECYWKRMVGNPTNQGRRRILKDKKCKKCGKTFRPHNFANKFCSKECTYKGIDYPKNGRYIKCLTCKKEIYIHPGNTWAKYCSYECRNKGQIKGKKLKCKWCMKSYYRPPSQVFYRGSSACSRKCLAQLHKDRFQKKRSENCQYPKGIKKFKKWTWKHFSDYIRERDNWTCFTCGKKEEGSMMHAGHFISRVRSAIMFDEKNVHAQCYSCNIYKRGNPKVYAGKIKLIYGEKELDRLLLESKKPHVFTYVELETIYQESKRKLKLLQGT